jgi:hypothetical protein
MQQEQEAKTCSRKTFKRHWIQLVVQRVKIRATVLKISENSPEIKRLFFKKPERHTMYHDYTFSLHSRFSFD